MIIWHRHRTSIGRGIW